MSIKRDLKELSSFKKRHNIMISVSSLMVQKIFKNLNPSDALKY